MTATLKLFNGVIAGTPQEIIRYNLKHGIVLDPGAAYAYDQIVRWYDEYVPTSDDLNFSFFKSWKDAESVSFEARLLMQLLHYFSTYGLAPVGDEFMFTPSLKDGHEPQSPIKFKVVKSYTRQEFINKCFEMLDRGALSSYTIETIFEVLWECDYKLTGEERVKNKEAQAIIYKKTGTKPTKGEELFRFLVYDATEESLIIKNTRLINMIKASEYRLELTYVERRELAKSFNRYKPLWLAFKKAHPDNASVVNEISRLSKSLHKPQPKDYLGTVTSEYHLKSDLKAAALSAPLPTVIRAMNACKTYIEESTARAYRIRNGKLHTRDKERSVPGEVIFGNLDTLKETIRERTGALQVYAPKHIHYAFPTSEKNFLGAYPAGTSIMIPKGEGQLLVGIHWYNQGRKTDIDLSATGLNSKVGWNSMWSEGGLRYSGDMTSAPEPTGAAEWLYASEINDSYLVQVNLYGGPLTNCKFKLIVGYGNDIDKNYMIDPNKIVFSADCEFTDDTRSMTLGVLRPVEGGAEFILCPGGLGGSRVSTGEGKESIARKALLTSLPVSVKVSDIFTIVDSVGEADLDLSPDGLTKDTVLQLLR